MANNAPGSIEVDNSSSVLAKIATLYAEQLMSDINLVVGGVTYPAHRLILCATSDVFQVMLMNREWSEWRETAVELKETPQCADVFPHFLKYFYTGQIRISHKSVLPVLSLADKYNIKDLVELCLCYMSRHMTHAAQHGNLVEWLQYTMACRHNQVAKACLRFVKWNLELIAETSDFGNFEPEVLITLLQQNDLVVSNELTLYRYVVKWLEHQKSKLLCADGLPAEDAKQHLLELVHATMSHVRFPMMTPRELAGLLVCPLTQDYKEFFVERMATGMSYHLGFEPLHNCQSIEDNPLLFMPRLYTEDRWSSQLTIENFQSLECYHTRTFVFSSHSAIADHAGDKTYEWVVDLYPKGVWFKKSLLISWHGSRDVPEVVLRTVRLAINCRDPPKNPNPSAWSQNQEDEGPYLRVKIGILITGVQWGIEHVMTVKERIYHFSESDRVLNIDDILDFDELNTPIYSPSSSSANANSSRNSSADPSKKCSQCSKASSGLGKYAFEVSGGPCSCAPEPSVNLVGPNRDQLKLQVVIIPLTDKCFVTSPDFDFM